MTTMAALFGALPLAFGTGTGSELRRPLGITIVGGLIVSQLLTLYTTPVVYLSLDNLRLRMQRRRRTSPGRPNEKRRTARLSSAAALVVALCGCTVGPKYHPPVRASAGAFLQGVSHPF